MKAVLPAALALVLTAPAFAAPAVDKSADMAKATAILKASAVPCTVVDVSVAFVGTHEVACKEGFGYFVIGGDETTKGDVKSCALLAELGDDKGLPVACALPANRNPYAIVDTIFTKQKVTDCTTAAVRYIGDTPTGSSSFYEVVCSTGRGMVVQGFKDGTLTNANTCGGTPPVSRGQPCELTAMGLEAAKADFAKRQAQLTAFFTEFDRPRTPAPAAALAPATAP